MSFKIVRNDITKLDTDVIIHGDTARFADGNEDEEQRLRSFYRKGLRDAKEEGNRSVALPLILAESFEYPKEEGMRIAADEIRAFLADNELQVFLVVFDERSNEPGKQTDPALEAYISRNYVDEKKREEHRDGFLSSIMKRSRKGVSAAKDSAPGGDFAAKTNASYMMGAACMAPMKPEESMMCMDEAPADFSDFAEEHESKLNERMRHISDTFSQYLMYLIGEKQMENTEVYKRAIVDKKIFSKIKNNADYHPQKLTALCLCVGAKLNLDESKDLLARAGYALSPCDKTDIIFSYFIENEIYDMIELDIQLEEHGLPCIIS